MDPVAVFSSDYHSARQRFRDAATKLGWALEAHPIDAFGPGGQDLTIDAAYSSTGDPQKTLVVSSGMHGIEGFFGSAVQLALLDQWAKSPPSVRCVFLHGLNPYGFAWLRRCDENNVDPNRNFLLPGEMFQGADPAYTRFDRFLNPRCPPSRWEPFTLKAMLLIARYGLPALRQAVAAGQYDYPRGLFFGGTKPSRMQELLNEILPRLLQGSRNIVHLDFHTGLGAYGDCKLLIDYPLSSDQTRCLTNWFGADAFEACHSSGIAYDARGGFGRWCVSRGLSADYLFACAEFGTYGPVPVLGGLRAENQAHHWGQGTSPSTIHAKDRLKELFCPASAAWRRRVIERSIDLVSRAIQGLAETSAVSQRCDSRETTS